MSADQPNPMFSECTVKSTTSAGDCLSIQPLVYLDFGNDATCMSNLVSSYFELQTEVLSQKTYDCIYVASLVALRDYLTGIQTAPIGETLEFESEEGFVVTKFTRRKTTLLIFGRTPDDEEFVHDPHSVLDARFGTQTTFCTNFPLNRIPEVVEQVTRILRAIDYPK